MLEFIGLITIVGGLYMEMRWLSHQFDAWLTAIIDGAARV